MSGPQQQDLPAPLPEVYPALLQEGLPAPPQEVHSLVCIVSSVLTGGVVVVDVVVVVVHKHNRGLNGRGIPNLRNIVHRGEKCLPGDFRFR